MDTMQYVQHVSGQGQKWQIDRNNRESWGVADRGFYLPKSEYRPCEPPVKVVSDITRTVSILDEGRTLRMPGLPTVLYTMPPGYRWGYHVDERNRYGLTIERQSEE